MGNFLRLLPSLDVVAVSQAPSPESNPDSRYPWSPWWRLKYHRKLIGQTFERIVAAQRSDRPRLSRVTKGTGRGGPDHGWVLDLINAASRPGRQVGARLHVLALELPQLSKYRDQPGKPNRATVGAKREQPRRLNPTRVSLREEVRHTRYASLVRPLIEATSAASRSTVREECLSLTLGSDRWIAAVGKSAFRGPGSAAGARGAEADT
ncbi:hypothetical protein G5714_024682 [Onychostoma macrolepis]|uniref:Uncharacterized protein n=1 Tax=Onychostoma macrolepis TaxID=369639 RepID=A0A7J6BHK1_9TELE|nr:hypothetical protein G5714_024682 [Onychostoma macrolepis]